MLKATSLRIHPLVPSGFETRLEAVLDVVVKKQIPVFLRNLTHVV